MYYACSEHIELALDTIVDEEEKFPNMEKVTEEHTCSFCENKAEYKVD